MSARRGQLAGPKNGNWRGGRVVDPRGYVLIRVGIGHPLADVRGYAYEHRLVASRTASVANKEVHHGDENTSNNAPDNLEPLTVHEHRAKHRKPGSRLRDPGEQNPEIACACGCGERFDKFDSMGRPRIFVSGHNPHTAPTQQAVIAALQSGPLHRSRLVDICGASEHAVAVCLSKLKRFGVVTSDNCGTWKLSTDRARTGTNG